MMVRTYRSLGKARPAFRLRSDGGFCAARHRNLILAKSTACEALPIIPGNTDATSRFTFCSRVSRNGAIKENHARWDAIGRRPSPAPATKSQSDSVAQIAPLANAALTIRSRCLTAAVCSRICRTGRRNSDTDQLRHQHHDAWPRRLTRSSSLRSCCDHQECEWFREGAARGTYVFR